MVSTFKKGVHVISETILFTFSKQEKSILIVTDMHLTFLTVRVRNVQISNSSDSIFRFLYRWICFGNSARNHYCRSLYQHLVFVYVVRPILLGQNKSVRIILICFNSTSHAKSHFETENSFFCLFLDSNNVKLLGTIMSAARTLPNGVKSVVVRTHEDRDA